MVFRMKEVASMVSSQPRTCRYGIVSHFSPECSSKFACCFRQMYLNFVAVMYRLFLETAFRPMYLIDACVILCNEKLYKKVLSV